MTKKDTENFCPASTQEWRTWLNKNHEDKQSVWLVYYKMKSGKATLSWSDAVDQALCFGWIDSTRRTMDEERFLQLFTKRKPRSVWSKINKEKIARLTEEGLMTPAGNKSVEVAKENGSWSILEGVEELEIPTDLTKAFRAHVGSKKFFEGLSRSVQKSILQWLVMAKRPETRQKRISEIATLAARGQKPKQF